MTKKTKLTRLPISRQEKPWLSMTNERRMLQIIKSFCSLRYFKHCGVWERPLVASEPTRRPTQALPQLTWESAHPLSLWAPKHADETMTGTRYFEIIRKKTKNGDVNNYVLKKKHWRVHPLRFTGCAGHRFLGWTVWGQSKQHSTAGLSPGMT